MFLEKFFPTSKTTSIRKEICGIRQHNGNTQQFGVREFVASRVVNKIVVPHNQTLENKIIELPSLVRQLSIGQHIISPPARMCGICAFVEHPTDACPTLQELCTNKRKKLKGDVEVGRNVLALIKNEQVSALIQPIMPKKCGDPNTFSVPCTIGKCNFDVIVDLGASINVKPSSIYKSLRLSVLEPIGIVIQLENRSIAHPLGILEAVLSLITTANEIQIKQKERLLKDLKNLGDLYEHHVKHSTLMFLLKKPLKDVTLELLRRTRKRLPQATTIGAEQGY
ncbi:hypothetical protein CR513_22956, partial [Mucuna pruriens]